MDSQSISLTSKEVPFVRIANTVVSVEPNQVSFRNYKLGQPVTQILNIINTSNTEQRFHILPLEKGPFSLRYEKKRNFLPGMKQIIQVQFHPNDFLKHSETLRIDCPHGQNLSISITAFAAPNLTGFPSTLHFPNTSINTNTSLQFTLSSDISTPFQFRMDFNPLTDVFSVTPSSGSIQADECIPITVTFCPQRLRTSISSIELTIPNTDLKVRTCSCTGSCLPICSNPTDKMAPVTVQKGPTKLKKRRLVTHKDTQNHIMSTAKTESKETTCPISIRDKEKDFLLAVRQRKEDGKLNQLKWSTNLGHSSITELDISLLTTQRESTISTQISNLNHTVLESVKLKRINDNSRFDYHILIPFNRQFPILNWKRKREMLSLFCLAAKRVVIQHRAERRLKCLQSFIREVKKLNLPADKYDTVFSKPKSSEDPFKSITPEMPIPFLFIRDKSLEEMEPVVPFVPIKMEMPVWEMEEEEEPLFQLVPPDYAEQQFYKKLPLAAVDNFLPFSFNRKKRKGAEHEYVGIVTEKRDDKVSDMHEEIIEVPTQQIPEHLLKDTSTPMTSLVIAPDEVQAKLPLCHVTGIDHENLLFPFTLTPFGHSKKVNYPEQEKFLNKSLNVEKEPTPRKLATDLAMKERNPTLDPILVDYDLTKEPEMCERNDKEKGFGMMSGEKLAGGEEFQGKVDARMKLLKNLMTEKLQEEVPDWMW